MIRKLLCWLGFHEWRHWENVKKVHNSGFVYYKVTGRGIKCKHCGAKKR